MRFDAITLFPDFFTPYLTQGVTRRAFASGQVEVNAWDLRDFAHNNYRRVDDRPYGGGPGMVMLFEPLARALTAVRQARAEAVPAPLVHFTPTGQRMNQSVVQQFADGSGAIFLCGRYEGIDQRFIDRHVDLEISLGDFVLSGGELPALVLLDAVARLQEGVLGDAQSHQQDSFSNGLLDCPHYSRPEVISELGDVGAVPNVLLSGHHGEIAKWRRERSLELTVRKRPDLIQVLRAAGRLSAEEESFLSTLSL